MNLLCCANEGVNAEGLEPSGSLCDAPAVCIVLGVDPSAYYVAHNMRVYSTFALCEDHEVSNLVMLKKNLPPHAELGVMRIGEVIDL